MAIDILVFYNLHYYSNCDYLMTVILSEGFIFKIFPRKTDRYTS